MKGKLKMKKIVLKLVALGIGGWIAKTLLALAPAINNELAMSQLQNDNLSLVFMNMFNHYETVISGALLIFAILLFQKDIRKLIKKGADKNE